MRVSEDDCVVCSRWNALVRCGVRQSIYEVPPLGPVCDECWSVVCAKALPDALRGAISKKIGR
jgi:hypothetical protein